MKQTTKQKISNWLDQHPKVLGWTDRFVQPKPLIRLHPILARHTVTPRGVALELKYHWWSEWKVLGYPKNGKPRLFPYEQMAKDYVRNRCPECRLYEGKRSQRKSKEIKKDEHKGNK